MINGPILVTERLILRPPSADDLAAWVQFHAEPQTMAYLGGVQDRANAWRGLCSMAGAWHISGFAMFSLILRSNGAWIGRVGPWQPDSWPGTEIGWGVMQAYAGQGYALEAAIATMDYAFDLLGWDEVIHIIAPDNIGSIKLAERLGSTNKGPTQMPAPFADLSVDKYGQSKAQWLANRKRLKAQEYNR